MLCRVEIYNVRQHCGIYTVYVYTINVYIYIYTVLYNCMEIAFPDLDMKQHGMEFTFGSELGSPAGVCGIQ